MITINKKMNLVVPLARADGTKVYVHSTPVGPETFETYYLVLAKTYARLMQNQLGPRSGPSVAAMLLRDISKETQRLGELNWWDGDDGVGGAAGFLQNLIRLSMVIVHNPDNNSNTVMLQEALDKGIVTEEEKSEVLNILTFFTVISLVAPRVDRANLIDGLNYIYESQTSLLNLTEFAASLKTLTTDGTSGERPTP